MKHATGFSVALVMALCLTMTSLVNGRIGTEFPFRDVHQRRRPDDAFNGQWLASNYQNGSTAPNAIQGDSPGQTLVIGGTGADDDSQRPGCDTAFIGTAQVQGSPDGGWQALPQVVGFDADRNTSFGNAVMPIYIERGKDFSKIKRVIVAQPGKPRDSWKYSSLFRNSLICAVSNSSMAVTLADVLIVAPIWLGESDKMAGAAQENDLYWTDGGFSVGSLTQGPGGQQTSSFEVMDVLIKRFANQNEFPILNSIVVAGHSLGASLAQRYAMLRKTDDTTESLVKYWVGNPGAYVWPAAGSSRPVAPSDTSCAAQIDDWAYGIGGSLPAYATADVSKGGVEATYQRYRNRTIQYALGLLDDGLETRIARHSRYQGNSHLSRGQNMQKALEAMDGGIPATQSFNYVPNTSHQDYLMMSDPVSQNFLFVEGLDDKRTATSSVGSTSTGTTGTDSGSTGTSTKKGATGQTTSGQPSSATALIIGCNLTALAAFAALAFMAFIPIS